jgi:hypothetical protein
MPPDTIHDDVFGELAYDPPMSEWYAEVEWAPKHPVEVTIWWDEAKDGPFAPVLERARTAYRRFVEREEAHRQALATAMLERYKRSQRPGGGALPGPTALARGLTLSSIAIDADGSATLHYDDAADLFGDHCILADLDAEGAFAGFTLQG